MKIKGQESLLADIRSTKFRLSSYGGTPVIAVVMILIIIIGVGAYFAFVAKSPQKSSLTNYSGNGKNLNGVAYNANQAQGDSSNLNCQGVLPVQDWENITGIKGWKEEKSTFDLQPGEFNCEYVYKDPSDTTTLQRGVILDIIITPTSVSDPQSLFNSLKSSFKGKDVKGLGFEAFQAPSVAGTTFLGVVSSNKKYFFKPIATYNLNNSHNFENDSKTEIEAAKIIDTNLNHY